MIEVMIEILEISVRMNRKLVPIHQRTSIFKGDFINAFWKWNDLSSYLSFINFVFSNRAILALSNARKMVKKYSVFEKICVFKQGWVKTVI